MLRKTAGMDSKGSLRGRVGRLMGLAVAATLSLGLVGSIAAPASAMTVTNSGSVGAAYVFRTSCWEQNMSGWIRTNPIDVYRTNAYSGTQKIQVTFRVWQYINGQGWKLFNSIGDPTPVSIPPGTHGHNPGYDFWNLWGYFKVDWTITWYKDTGVWLGTTFLNFTAQGDYSASPGCTIVYVGGQYSASMF
jgi:hypothetical protein